MQQLVEGQTYKSKKGVKFKVLKINETENKIQIIFLKSGLETVMYLDHALKYLYQKEEPCGGKR